MNKAYVGFSSPVGYDYNNPANKCSSDMLSSPNPVLVGVTGLLVLFDEIWFPCPSVCPNSMRHLSYVKFVSEEFDELNVDIRQVTSLDNSVLPDVSLNSLHPDGFSKFFEEYYGVEGGVDNHTRTISCLGKEFVGNPSFENLALDLLLLEQLGEGFTHTLNGLTRQMAFPPGLDWLRKDNEDQAIRLADNALTISSIYDLTGPDGPYHPVMEELREHDFIKSFRKWIRNEASTMHNRSACEVMSDLNSITRDFEKSALRSEVSNGSLKNVTISLLEGVAVDLIPGSSSVKAVLDSIDHKRNLEQKRLSTYVAESRGAIWQAHHKTTLYRY